MAKAKKVEKRSAPKKAATKQAERIIGRLTHLENGLKKAFANPDPPPRKKVLKPVPKNKPDPDGYAKLADAIMHGTPERRRPDRAEPQTRKGSGQYAGKKYTGPIPQDPTFLTKIQKPAEPEQPKIEISVRNVYYDGQYLPALCFRKPGALHVPCVCGDPVNGIRKFTIAAPQHDKSTVLQHGYGAFAAEYSPERFASHMRTIAGAAPITPEARAMLLPYCPDMPLGPAPAELPAPDDEAQPVRARTQPGNGSRAPSGPARTSGKELIRTLADAAKLPPEKVRAKLRAAGLRAPYTDETACRKALGVRT